MGDSHFAWTEILTRLLAAVAAGAAIGIDREWRRKTAGLRTHMLFALSCAGMTILALDIYLWQRDLGTFANPDATRIIQGVITGMSFLGAGAIMRGQHRIHGLTTGAGVWLAGSLGLIFGAGLYMLGALTLLLGMTILVLIRMIEPRDIKRQRLSFERDAELHEMEPARPTHHD